MRVLLLLCACSFAAAAADNGWRSLMRDEHEAAIDAAHERAAAVLDQLPADAYGRADLPKVRALLDAPTQALTADRLPGAWRCRSTQVDRNGVFGYPNFRCVIELTEDGTLMFTKTSGSQRRHGQIYPRDDHSWVFLGGQSVNDDPYRDYSATLASASDDDRASDSIGLIETLKDGRIRILFDADDESVEFYELSR